MGSPGAIQDDGEEGAKQRIHANQHVERYRRARNCEAEKIAFAKEGGQGKDRTCVGDGFGLDTADNPFPCNEPLVGEKQQQYQDPDPRAQAQCPEEGVQGAGDDRDVADEENAPA